MVGKRARSVDDHVVVAAQRNIRHGVGQRQVGVEHESMRAREDCKIDQPVGCTREHRAAVEDGRIILDIQSLAAADAQRTTVGQRLVGIPYSHAAGGINRPLIIDVSV